MKKYLSIIVCLIIFCIAFVSCSLRRSEPLKGEFIPKNKIVEHGQSLYNLHCQKCHPAGEAGLGPDLNWNPAPGFVKKFQVRHGLGVMPSFKADEISKQDLEAISKYMKAFKNQRRA